MTGSTEPRKDALLPSSHLAGAHLRGFILLAGGQLGARVLTLATLMYLARVLGVEAFGAIGFAAVVVSYFLVWTDAGLDLVGMRAIAGEKAPIEDIVSAIVTARLALCATAALPLWLLARLLTDSPAGAALVFAYGLTLLSFAVNLRWGFQALEQQGRVAVMFMVSQGAYLGGVVALVRGPGDTVRVPLVLFGAELIGAAFLLAQYHRHGFRLRLSPPAGLAWRLIRSALPLGAARWLRTLQLNFDILLLGLLMDSRSVGLYVAASRITLVVREVAEMYFIPLFTRLSATFAEEHAAFAAVAHAGLRYAAVLMVPVVVGGALTAEDLLSLAFGTEYASAARVLGLLLAAVLFAAFAGTYRMALIAAGRQRSILWITLAGAALNVGMNLVLVPRYGMDGAAVSGVAAEVVIFATALWTLSRTVHISPWRPVLAPVLAVVGMAVVVEMVRSAPFGVVVAAAVLTYAVLVPLTGGIRPREIAAFLRGRASAMPK